jgi:hypothetical protein
MPDLIVESDGEPIPRGLPRGKRANTIKFFSNDRRFPPAFSGELQSSAHLKMKSVLSRPGEDANVIPDKENIRQDLFVIVIFIK